MDPLAAREAELLRMDEELERKQRLVVDDANEALKAQESRLDAILGRNLGQQEDPPSNSREEDERKSSDQPRRKPTARKRVVVRRSVMENNISSDEEEDPVDRIVTGAPKEIGPDAVIRLQRAKLKNLSEDVKKTQERIKILEEQNHTFKKKAKQSTEEAHKSNKRLQIVENTRDKLKVENSRQKDRIADLELQISNLTKELKQTDRAVKKVEDSQGKKDIRLNRALEEIEKLKEKLRTSEASQKDSEDKEEVRQLRAQLQKVERQKQELFTAFRKQLKLIDILKRQKIHLEAAKMLSFTEDEFTRTLETHS